MGLNHAHLHNQILLFDPFLPINKVFSLILQEQKQREIFCSLSSNECVVMLSNHDSSTMKNSDARNGKILVTERNTPIVQIVA